MIIEWTTPFIDAKDEFIAWLKEQRYPGYESMLMKAVEIIHRDGDFDYASGPSPERVTVIDHGHYQGTIVFVIGASGYQPYRYWATQVGYGSCSGCDTLQSAWGYGDDHNYEEMWTLALHMVQRVKEIANY